MSVLHQNWKLLDPLLDQALSLPEDQRDQFVSKVVADDASLGEGLMRLLAGASSQPPWLERGAALGENFLAALTQAHPQPSDLAGQRVGPFEIEREIGQGGMAQVFLAHRADGLFEQQVALKMMWQGLVREDLASRFERERQILADLNDPHIAALLDGGVTDQGRPWLAMEYVAGQPIDVHCNANALHLQARVDLISDVAAAVAAAHRRNIIHRDIKPSNVLVDESGQVKLVDFGIAKLLGDTPDAATVTEARVLTPEYASPEQIEGQTLGRESDVYQLGLLLFELVTGARPFSRGGASPLTFQRRIVETPAPRPSKVAAASGPSALQVDRDLDAVILKCLEKDPGDRYATVEDLLQDLHNYRRGLPLLAGAGQRWYRVRKFVARHRLGVSVASAFALLLMAYAGTVTWQSARITAQRDAARLETAKAQEIASFMQDLFKNASPAVSLGKNLTIKEMVDLGSEQLATRLEDQPELKAAMLENLGGIYASLGEYPRAIDHFKRALVLREAANSQSLTVADTLQQLGSAQRGAGEFAAALDSLGRALDIRQANGNSNQLALAANYSELGVTHSELRDNKTSGDYHLKALELRRLLLPIDDVRLALSKADYGVVLHKQARRAEAGELYREAAAVQELKLGPTHPRTLTTLRNLAVLQIGLEDLPEADRLLRQVLAREQTIYQGDHPKMAWTLGYLGQVARDRGRLDEAEVHWRETVRVLSQTLPNNHLHTAGANHELGKILLAADKVTEACERMESTLAIRLEQRGESSLSTNQSRFHLGRCRAAQGNRGAALRLLETARPYLADTEDAQPLEEALASLESAAAPSMR